MIFDYSNRQRRSSKEKLLVLGLDEPIVNKKVFRLVNEVVKTTRSHELINIR